MKTLFRVAVLLALVAGVTRPAEAKDCHEPPVPDVGHVWGCKSTFTIEGSPDVGGNEGDKLQTRRGRLWWWIQTDASIKVEFKNFKLIKDGTPYCPGTFRVEGNSYTDCQFTVKDKQEGWTLVRFAANDDAGKKAVKFDIVITDIVKSNTIDPQIEIDTGYGMNLLLIVLPIVGLVGVTLVTLWFIQASRRKRREAR
jgi:hypothetical protein